MSSEDFVIIGLQLILPVGLLLWLAFAPPKDCLSYLVRTITIALFILPWWTPRVYIAAAAGAILSHVIRGKIPSQAGWSQTGAARPAVIKLVDFGLRAKSWRREDPSVYAVFGEPVYVSPAAARFWQPMTVNRICLCRQWTHPCWKAPCFSELR